MGKTWSLPCLKSSPRAPLHFGFGRLTLLPPSGPERRRGSGVWKASSSPSFTAPNHAAPLSLHTVGVEIQDSRVARGKTNQNQFTLEFHPRGIFLKKKKKKNQFGLTPAENEEGGGVYRMQSFLDTFLVSSPQKCAWERGTPTGPLSRVCPCQAPRMHILSAEPLLNLGPRPQPCTFGAPAHATP